MERDIWFNKNEFDYTVLPEKMKHYLAYYIEKSATEVDQSLSDLKVTKGKGVPYTYCLALERNCLYVGATFNLRRRMKSHFKGRGSNWTKKHHPIAIKFLERHDDVSNWSELLKKEQKLFEDTKEYFGIDKVRGAGYCSSSSIKREKFKQQVDSFSNN